MLNELKAPQATGDTVRADGSHHVNATPVGCLYNARVVLWIAETACLRTALRPFAHQQN